MVSSSIMISSVASRHDREGLKIDCKAWINSESACVSEFETDSFCLLCPHEVMVVAMAKHKQNAKKNDALFIISLFITTAEFELLDGYLCVSEV